MATATAIDQGRAHAPANRPNLVAVGTIVWLSSELMFFAALFAMYLTSKSVNPEVWAEQSPLLNLRFAAVNTTILVLSSVTCQLGVFAAERGDVHKLRVWFTITLLMGTTFVLGQVYEYIGLISEGVTLPGSPFGSVFYLTTGFHGLHVTFGLVAFLFILVRTYYVKRFNHQQATAAIVVSYYWHFVDVVWVGLFTMIYLIR